MSQLPHRPSQTSHHALFTLSPPQSQPPSADIPLTHRASIPLLPLASRPPISLLLPAAGPSAATHRPPPRRHRRSRLAVLRSILYHTSFYLFILVTAILLVGSAWGLGQEAWRTAGQRRWNIVMVVGTYVAVGIISILHVWSRLVSIKKILRTMPKPYMPTKQVDLPRKVADHISTEFSRTAVIAHISQATKGKQEGWGRPGTKWENQHFRTHILSTLPAMRQALAPGSTAPPLSLAPLILAAETSALRVLVNSYAKLVEQARYARREPLEKDAAACEKLVEVITLTLEVKRHREAQKEVDDEP